MWIDASMNDRDFVTACSVYASAEDLDRLADSADSSIRWAVAGNRNASTSTLTRLAVDDDETVWEEVGRNPNTPPSVRLWLQSDYRKTISLEEFLKAANSGE